MADYHNLKSAINLKESPFIKDVKTVKISAVSKGTSTYSEKPDSLEVYVNDKKHGVEYSVVTCLNLFVQTFNNMCLDAEIVNLYKHFVLCRRILLFTYTGEKLVQCTKI